MGCNLPKNNVLIYLPIFIKKKKSPAPKSIFEDWSRITLESNMKCFSYILCG